MAHENEDFLKSYIAVCETCNGAGKTDRTFGNDSEMMSWLNDHDSIEEECPDCNGSGRWLVAMYRRPFGPAREKNAAKTFAT